MKKHPLIPASILSVAMLAACGGGNGSDSPFPDSPFDLKGADKPQNLSDPAAAKATASFALGFASTAGGSPTATAKSKRAESLAKETANCPDGGTVDVSQSESGGVTTTRFVFSNCKDGQTTTNGVLVDASQQSGSDTTGTFTFGENGTPFRLEDREPPALVAQLLGDDLYEADTSDFSPFRNLFSAFASFSSLSGNKQVNLHLGTGPCPKGKVCTAEFRFFEVRTEDTSDGGESFRVNGPFQVAAFGLGTQCPSGAASAVTNEDVVVDSGGVTRSGIVTLNSDDGTSALIVFNDDGTVTITPSNGVAQTLTEDELENLCDPSGA